MFYFILFTPIGRKTKENARTTSQNDTALVHIVKWPRLKISLLNLLYRFSSGSGIDLYGYIDLSMFSLTKILIDSEKYF